MFAMSDAWLTAMLVALVAVSIVLFGLLVWGVLKGIRAYNGWAERSLARQYDGVEVHEQPEPGDVLLVFHTYHGLLAWVVQQEHRAVLPRDEAVKLLDRLHRFNLGWGLLSYGALYVPFVTYGNYWAQRRSFRKQAARNAGEPFAAADAATSDGSR